MARQADKLAARAAREVGIPVRLFVSLIMNGERSWKGWQTSPSGARGPAQLMPGTAAGLERRYGINTKDYYGNLLGGAYYLREQLAHFHDPKLAVAAYNAGPGAVEEHGGVPPYKQTQDYVANVFGGLSKTRVQEAFRKPSGNLPGSLGQSTTLGTPPGSIMPPSLKPTFGAPPPGIASPDVVGTAAAALGEIATGGKATGTLEDLVDAQTAQRTNLFAAQPQAKTVIENGRRVPALVDARGHPVRSAVRALDPGGGWGGSYGPASALARIGENMGLKPTSEKRDTKMTASGNPSDHWVGSKNAYAYDLGGTQAEMDRAAIRIAAQLGVKYNGKRELVLTKTVHGVRYQILYRTHVGGDHFTHIHVGVKVL
jgi:hypothetical protein